MLSQYFSHDDLYKLNRKCHAPLLDMNIKVLFENMEELIQTRLKMYWDKTKNVLGLIFRTIELKTIVSDYE